MTPNGMRVWLVTRYADVRAGLADPRLSKDVVAAGQILGDGGDEGKALLALPPSIAVNLLSMDAPQHTRLRKIANAAFTPARARELRPRIAEIVDSLLSGLAGRERVDLVTEIARPLPILLMCELLGLPAADADRLRGWTETLVSMSTRSVEEYGAAGHALHDYLTDVIAEPSSDLVRDLVTADLTELELVSLLAVMVIGGFETTANLIGTAMLALFAHPDQLAQLRDDPSLLPGAVEELIRFDGPVHMGTFRYTKESVTFGDTVIPAGEVVMLSLLSANRDEEQFADADRLDLTRAPAGHVGFGHGAHYCLGAALARVECEAMLGGLLDRFPEISLAEPAASIPWQFTLLTRGVESLPVRLSPAPRPAAVSDFYDVYTHLLLRSWDVNFHYGYWLSADDNSSVAVAAERLTDVLIDLLELRPGERMLDVGCGIGEPAIRLASRVDAAITGVSINRGQVLTAAARAAAAGVVVRFEEADALELPYADGSFDAAWAFESLLHMDRDRALREIHRVLRPGGRVVIADLLQRAPLTAEHRAAYDDALTKFALSQLPTVDDYRALVADAGLVLDQVIDISEHTRPTMRHLADNVRAHRAELEARHGDAARQLIDVLLHPVADLPEYGYLLVTAYRPR
ncbi:2-methoxy-6-polyprenyl-1,4-benzoquinol methylase, mitochondrial [Kutzneria sp. CA-103260]|nr:2-methoxy-6-polyprenyl-1,4-benzoquinol methylase, mitochondrial [Kutzneria sp. CA-103260]